MSRIKTSLSLDESTINRIKFAAASEKRSMSNWVEVELEKAFGKRRSPNRKQTRRVK